MPSAVGVGEAVHDLTHVAMSVRVEGWDATKELFDEGGELREALLESCDEVSYVDTKHVVRPAAFFQGFGALQNMRHNDVEERIPTRRQHNVA